MTCEVEEETFTFDQLSDKAKEKARDKWRYSPGYLDYDWWEHMYEDAVRMGKLIGLEVGDHVYAAHSGKTYTKPDIWFRGFCSQGDGCCWSGHIVTRDLNGAVERIKTETSDEDLLGLAQQAEALYGEIAAIAAFNRLCDDDTNRDWPDISFDMRLPVVGSDRSYSSRVDCDTLSPEINKAATELAEAFASWIYDQLEAENEYLMSDECVDESIDSACLTFDEDGNEL